MSTSPWFAEHAGQRVEPARCYDLGLGYATGEGAPLDLVAAHACMNLAALAGHQEARVMRAELAEEMTSDEIARAQQLARQWQRRHAH